MTDNRAGSGMGLLPPPCDKRALYKRLLGENCFSGNRKVTFSVRRWSKRVALSIETRTEATETRGLFGR
jgi:hypothetical protein